MASQAELNLLRVLKSAVDDDDLSLVERTAGQILASSPSDKDASHCNLVALLLQNKHKEALTFINRHPELLPEHNFHKAYCLYRSHQDAKCAQLLESIPNSQRNEGVHALLAQIQYRLNDGKVVSTLQKLSPEEPEDVAETQTNLLAACVISGQTDTALSIANDSGDASYEYLYNWSCALIQKGNYQAAMNSLERAIKRCRSSLAEEDADEAEIQNSTAVLEVQRAYVLQLEGKKDAAMEIYQSVLNTKPSDESVVAVASNNIVTLRSKDHKVFDSLKRSQRASNAPKNKFTKQQREIILFNRCLLLIMAKQPQKARKVVQELRREFPTSEYPAFVEAYFSYSEQKFDACVSILQKFCQEHPDDSLRCQLTLAQIHLLRDDVKSAISMLKSIPEIPHQPAGVATLVSLYEKIDDIEGACAVFRDAIAYWDGRKTQNKDNLTTLHTISMKSAEYLLRHERFAEAAASYEKVVSEFKDKSSMEYQRVVGELVVVAAKVDPSLALKFEDQLPPVADLEDVDMETLETVAFTRAERMKTERKVEQKERIKKKKKKRKRLPKNYDPNGPKPDPERWLPRWERKSNKKKRRKQNIQRGGQGIVNMDRAAALDRTNQPDVGEEKKVPVPNNKNNKNNKKKKKKKKRR